MINQSTDSQHIKRSRTVCDLTKPQHNDVASNHRAIIRPAFCTVKVNFHNLKRQNVRCVGQHCKLFYLHGALISPCLLGDSLSTGTGDGSSIYTKSSRGSLSSAENKVDDLWTAICTWQFPITEDYLIRVRDRLIPSKPGSPDITIE
ncbi:hypothetical protein M430DRAFT_175108 [Amorphotheca resinae ATCC 22711]|jgi:hypothetical protein|uniref:Uncharacterized protein n=1 Tax=Amorphotheca resinae ATCC 22711 TaxID=857342 RepID=A0A2T3ASP0_AMORE|nr:hypothetical protein M430DRAFT_175108 [Amorphotheca resinae ATCC 22711]PSS10487.1 hypothetical protein M430DRAFT_175108 [Amorphotheca resinae ATCC 22711]